VEPLDLTKQPPRSPRVTVNGLVMMARTIDKVRASLPGGKSGEYKLAGFSQELLDELGIEEPVFRAVVLDARTDDDVAHWLAEHTDPARYDEINRIFSEETVHNFPATFHERYPVAKKYNLTNIFDVLEFDDRELFGISHPH